MTTTVVFVYRRHLPPVILVLRCLFRSYKERIYLYETSTLLGKVWLQVGFEPMPLAFWVSTLTTRPLMSTLPSALIQGLYGQAEALTLILMTTTAAFVYRRHLPPVKLVLRCLFRSYKERLFLCTFLILLYYFILVRFFSYTEHLIVSKTSFQSPLCSSSGLRTT